MCSGPWGDSEGSSQRTITVFVQTRVLWSPHLASPETFLINTTGRCCWHPQLHADQGGCTDPHARRHRAPTARLSGPRSEAAQAWAQTKKQPVRTPGLCSLQGDQIKQRTLQGSPRPGGWAWVGGAVPAEPGSSLWLITNWTRPDR